MQMDIFVELAFV